MPFKRNHDRRHRIPKQKHRVQDWRGYDASLRQRGSLMVWFSDEAIEGWCATQRTTPGGQPWYSPLAILTTDTTPSQRDRHIRMIQDRGRLGWQRAVGYGRRSLEETAIFREACSCSIG